MMPELIDIHCHLDFPEFIQDQKEVIKRALDNNLWFINIGTRLETSQRSIDMASKREGVFAAVGLHPTDRGKEIFSKDAYRELAKHPKVVAIGECGLDYFRIKNEESRIKQKEVFKQQIELAIEIDKPLMIHIREARQQGEQAYDEAFEILNFFYLIHNTKLRGNIHFFSGSREQAKKYLDLGFSFSFTGVITFTRDYDEVIKELPLEKIMVETDAPFVSPVPHRGKRCEPLFLKHVAQRIAEIRGISYEEIAKQTTQNAIDFFGLKV